MLSKKYYQGYLNNFKNMTDLDSVLKQIIKIEKELNVEVINWGENELVEFLKSFKAVSPHSLNKYTIILRDFADHICDNEKLPRVEYKLKDGNFEQLIDTESLLKVTLSYQQYRYIKSQLSAIRDGVECNVRDKVIFELAWTGLTSDEIRSLKRESIQFTKSEYDTDVAILFLHTDRIVRVEDHEIVDDIKKCMIEDAYFIVTKAGVAKRMPYRESEYLIKPVSVGRNKKETYLDNPGTTLKAAIKANDITCPGVDIDNLTVEDIRRSKLIYLLSPENQEYFDDETIAGLFNLKSSYALVWMKRIAQLKSQQNDVK